LPKIPVPFHRIHGKIEVGIKYEHVVAGEF